MLGRLNEAISAFKRAGQTVGSLRSTFPDDVDYRRTEASLKLDLGSLQLQAGQVNEGLENYSQAVDAYRGLVSHPKRRAYDPLLLSMALRGKGESLRRSGRLDEAEKALADAGTSAGELDQTDKNILHVSARIRLQQSLLLAAQSQTMEESEKPLEEAIEIWRRLAERWRDSTQYQTYRSYLARALTVKGIRRLSDGDADDQVRAILDESNEIMASLIQQNAEVPSYPAALSENLASLARWAIANGQSEPALDFLQRAQKLQQGAASKSPENASYQENLIKRQRDLTRFRNGDALD